MSRPGLLDRLIAFNPVGEICSSKACSGISKTLGRSSPPISRPGSDENMTIVYHIDQGEETTYVVWDGVVTAEQYISHVQRLLADSDWPTPRSLHLSDLRSTSLDPTINQPVLQEAVEMFARHPKISTVKTAIIAHEAFHQALLYERLISPVEPSVIVFHNLDTACMWLGTDSESAARALQSLRTQARNGSAP
jgi:hypothetical protein